MNKLKESSKSIILSAVFSILYVGLVWLCFTNKKIGEHYQIMSWSFLFICPFICGFLINHFAPKDKRGKFQSLILKPVFFAYLPLVVAFTTKIEGLICVVMALPIFFIMASLGATFHYLLSKRFEKGIEAKSMVAILFIPLVVGPAENIYKANDSYSISKSQILINASTDIIWENIIRVPEIKESEIPIGISKLMGFPDPVEATLSFEGIGGIRKARFKGNVLFTEIIDQWINKRKLSFTIEANTKEIPPETMDEHMIVGGKYFNVLRGTYEIESIGNGKSILRLESKHVSKTNFNIYTKLWGNLIMKPTFQGRRT